MKADELIAEIRADFYNFSAAGLIDDLSIYRWMSNSLLRFGNNITTQYEDVVQVRNGKANLPDNFYSLLFAGKCEPFGYECSCEPEKISVLQHSMMWKERTEHGFKWNSCDGCCKEEYEKTIVENVYIDMTPVNFRYKNPIPLKLVKSKISNKCIDECKNKYVVESPYEISVREKTAHVNFGSGSIYIQYKGLPIDEEGKPYIPETSLGRLKSYIESQVKSLMCQQIGNSGDALALNLYKMYEGESMNKFPEAMRETKMETFDVDIYRKMALSNRRKVMAYEIPFLNNF